MPFEWNTSEAKNIRSNAENISESGIKEYHKYQNNYYTKRL
jgi:hypothetical protein